MAAMWLGRKSDAPDLGGKVVIVTGGARGLGLTIAEACHQAGAQVALFDRDRAALFVAVSVIPWEAL